MKALEGELARAERYAASLRKALEARAVLVGDTPRRPDAAPMAAKATRRPPRARTLKVCAAPDCSERFVPKGRQIYHHPSCRSRTNMRLARDREDDVWRSQTAALKERHPLNGAMSHE